MGAQGLNVENGLLEGVLERGRSKLGEIEVAIQLVGGPRGRRIIVGLRMETAR